MSWRSALILILSSFLTVGAVSEQCSRPHVAQSTYTTRDATVLKHVAYIVDFEVTCEAGAPGNLYGLLAGDAVVPIARVAPGRYQLSWTEDARTATVGEIAVAVYDEVGYAAVRRGLRAGEGVRGVVGEFAVLSVNHPGVYTGPWVSCEFLAVGFSVVVAYVAIHFRSKLLS